jgi:DNA polymerase-1
MRALVIDGNSLVYRCFYASINQLEYYKQTGKAPVNALKLFLLIVTKIMHQTNYNYVLVAFDHAKKTNRHSEFSEYKSGRKPMPPDLVTQLPLIQEALTSLNIKFLSEAGFEADDIIGSFAKLMNDNKIEVDIYSTDKDMLQLVNQYTSVHMFKVGISETTTVNFDNFGFHFHGLIPSQVCDFKGISGDSSDNLSGVKGIGPKTASALLKRYDSLDNIYKNLSSLSPAHQEKFTAAKTHALLCKKLSTIDTSMYENHECDMFTNNSDFRYLKVIAGKYNFQGFDKYYID